MPSSRHSLRLNTLELKAEIIRKVGHQKAEKYFYHLNGFLSFKLGKSELNKVCIGTIGRDNVSLHNRLLGSIIKNACLAKTPPSRGSKVEGLSIECQRSSLQSLCGDAFPLTPRKGRSSNQRERKFRDRPSPLGPDGKILSIVCDEAVRTTQQQQSATELVSLGSRPLAEVASVEDGEEVEQIMGSPSVQSRSPVRAPLGIPINTGGSRKALRGSSLTAFHPDTYHNSYELPDTRSLRKILEKKLEMEGLGITIDCVNLLNNGLDAFLKRLIKPCIELSRSRRGHEHLKQVNDKLTSGLNGVRTERHVQRSTQSISASLLDFRVAMELNPELLGEDWPKQLERVCLHISEE